ncbi:MAG: AAA family ATPase [Alphaproteobacteria bacterium]|nr:AAA family ATPase [Alphaproteobacteria bacterium]
MLEHPHLERLHAALRSEERFAHAAHENLTRLPLADRVALGVAWSGLRFDVEPGFRRGELLVLARGELHEGIGAGDRIRVGALTGRCIGRDASVAELVVRATPAEWEAAAAAGVVDLGFDPSTFVRYRQALEAADALESPVKTALLEGVPEAEPVEAGWEGLNPSQARAAGLALGAAHLAVVHGPPGTGKTRTLVAILARLEERSLALAESNAAVDHLVVSAARAGLAVVRVGPTYRMSGEAAALSVDAQIAAGPHAAALAVLDREISRARREGGPALWKLLDARRALREQARRHVLESAAVVGTTFGTLARAGDRLPRVHTAVVDEVTQALEPAVWVAVPHVQRLILAGDPHQLGPVVTEPGNPLEEGLLQRLRPQVPMPMLTVQHRMHEDVQLLVEGVYGPTYTAHPAVRAHLLADLPGVAEHPLTTVPALFVDTAGAGGERRDSRTHSVYEPLEVRLVAVALAALRAKGVRADQIGVIAPYSAQVARLAALPEAKGVEVATVNAFQGREAEAVIVSFTRSNPDGELGFVADRRRLTVAVTRARRLLLMFGDSATLTAHPMFGDLLDRVEVQSVWEPPWDSAGS